MPPFKFSIITKTAQCETASLIKNLWKTENKSRKIGQLFANSWIYSPYSRYR